MPPKGARTADITTYLWHSRGSSPIGAPPPMPWTRASQQRRLWRKHEICVRQLDPTIRHLSCPRPHGGQATELAILSSAYLRISGGKTIARAAQEQPEIMTDWFALYDRTKKETTVSTARIVAGDETGFAGDSSTGQRVVAPTGARRVHTLTSGYREHVSVMHACTATGFTVPPLLVFTGSDQTTPINLLDGVKDRNWRCTTSESGYFNQDHTLGAAWQHIHAHVHANSVATVLLANQRAATEAAASGSTSQSTAAVPAFDAPMLLVLDGAKQHYSPEALVWARAVNLHVLILPPQLTHLLQVSDLAVFAPLKRLFAKASREWRAEHPHLRLTRHNFAKVLEGAWQAACRSENVLGGWRKSGLEPFDPSVVLVQVGQKKPTEISVEFEYRQEEALALQYEQLTAIVQALSAERARNRALHERITALDQSSTVGSAEMARFAFAPMGAPPPVRVLSEVAVPPMAVSKRAASIKKAKPGQLLTATEMRDQYNAQQAIEPKRKRKTPAAASVSPKRRAPYKRESSALILMPLPAEKENIAP